MARRAEVRRRVLPIRFPDTPRTSTVMEVIAHRGFADCGTENALETLRRATDVADAVEFDVRLAGDGEPVVFHDRTVDRLTGACGPIAAHTAAELAELALDGTAGTIPTLAAVLDALEGPVVVDLKADDVTDRLLGLLRAYDGSVLVSAFDPDVLAALPGDVDVALLCAPAGFQEDLPEEAPADVGAAVDRAAGMDATAVHPHVSQCSPGAVATAHGAGLRVNAWTVRSREVAAALQRADVDGAIADSPDYVDG